MRYDLRRQDLLAIGLDTTACTITTTLAPSVAMSRPHSAPSIHRAVQVAQDMLARRVSAGAGELLECIHAINPTGRSLGAADERRRYELKARLQSLLIRTFSDDLVVTPDAPGVVAIRHRYLGQDACHARIDELEDDARARVRWLLDTAEAADPAYAGNARPPAAQAVADADSLAQGRAALAEFDYETARAHFEAAALGQSGDPEAARELLELLVDHMALDDDALALEDQLVPRAAADVEVRALLAVAASRTGNAEAANRLLQGLTGPRVAEAWKALAEDAIRRQAYDDLERSIARLADADPTHPDLVRLRAEAQRLRSDARRPAEQELLQTAETGNASATEAAARALLARWPDSPVAGRLLSRIQGDQRAAEATRLLASARAALADGAIERATELGRRARSVGADTAELLDQIREADAAQRRARDDAEVAAVCARLAEEDPRPGLAALLALEPELRQRVRSHVELAMLEWLEQAQARNKGARPGALIDAVLAIAAAADALARGDDERALALLEPHGAMIADLPRANELQAEARRGIAARRRAAAASALEQARCALAGGDLELCERLCDQADCRDLDPAQRPELDHVRREVRGRRELTRCLALVDRLVASGDLVSARHELEVLLVAELVDVDHATALRRRLDDLRAELRRAWCVGFNDVDQRRDRRDLVGELLGRLPYTESTMPWLVTEGRELVVASAEGPHLFLGRISVDDGRVRDRRYLRAPEPFGELLSATVDGDALWVVGDTGRVLQVSLTTGEPVRWLSLTPFLRGLEKIERVFFIPGGSHLWLEVSPPGGAPSDRVIEIASWRLRRELPAARSFQPLVAGSSSGVIGMGLDGGAVRYTERGAVAEDIAACARMQVSAIVIDPDRELVVVGSQLDGTGEIELSRIKAGRTIYRRTLTDSSSDMAHCCASARGPGLLVVCHHFDRGDAELAVFRSTDPELTPVYAVAAASDVILAQDADATQVVGIWDSSRGVEIARLGPQPPAFGDAIGLHARWFAPLLASPFLCGSGGASAGDTELISVANRAANRDDWHEVRSLLENVPHDRIAPRWLAHHCHLLGIAWLRTGAEPARARELWQLGRSHDQGDGRYFTCRLDVCLDLVEPLPDPLPDEWWSSGASFVRQLRGAIATADRLLAAGEPEAALEAMRRRVVTGNHELQSAVRLAAAWLAITPSGTDDCFDKAIALARFVALAARPTIDLPIEGAWSRDQLTSVAARAEQWLATWHERR